jgi:hypothetical protein
MLSDKTLTESNDILLSDKTVTEFAKWEPFQARKLETVEPSGLIRDRTNEAEIKGKGGKEKIKHVGF